MANARDRTPMPRWVKVMGAVLLAIVVLGGAMVALGHNPMQHFGTHMGG